MANQPAVIVRTYRSKSQEDAAKAFATDAARLAAEGYHPASQSWAPGSYGCGAFLVALLLCVLLVGILIFIYMLLVKPAGTLTVTYERRTIAVAASSGAREDRLERLERLADLHDRGVLTDDEFAVQKRELLGS